MSTNAQMTWQEKHDAFIAFMAEESPVAFLVHQEMRRGKGCSEAIDFICGEGSFAKFAEEIWRNCRAA